MTHVINALLVTATILGATLASSDASAIYRRPGMTGVYSQRLLTQPRNSLKIVLGPGVASLVGFRDGGTGVDGGYQLNRTRFDAPSAAQVDHSLNVGVSFGILENLEATALFLSMDFTPKFKFARFPVALTWSKMFEDVDIAARLTMGVAVGDSDWRFDFGVPLLWRFGAGRLDTALSFPLDLAERVTIGLSVPVRLTFNATPALSLGIDTGFHDPDFGKAGTMAVPVGFVARYTFMMGKRLADLSASFQWDNFWLPDAVDGVDSLQTATWRFNIGLNLMSIVL